MSGDLVSVIVTTHYRNERLQSALESVVAQEYRPLEVLVVDDSSDRHAEPVVDEWPDVEYVHHAGEGGPQPARTLGVQRTTGRYVQFLDDDDRLLPGKLEKQVARLAAREAVGVVYCGVRYESGRVERPNPEARGDVLEQALEQWSLYPCVTSTMLFTRPTLEAILPLTPMPGAGDVAFRIELAQRTRFDFVDEPLLWKGEPEANRGDSLGNIRGNFQILERYSDLYDDRPALRGRLRSLLYRRLVDHYLRNSAWSARAIHAQLQAALSGRPTPGDFLYAAALLAGRPGYDAATRLRRLAGRTT